MLVWAARFMMRTLQAKLAEGDPDRWDAIADGLTKDLAHGMEVARGLAEEATEDERRELAAAGI
jgi:hypothetical protein